MTWDKRVRTPIHLSLIHIQMCIRDSTRTKRDSDHIIQCLPILQARLKNSSNWRGLLMMLRCCQYSARMSFSVDPQQLSYTPRILFMYPFNFCANVLNRISYVTFNGTLYHTSRLCYKLKTIMQAYVLFPQEWLGLQF